MSMDEVIIIVGPGELRPYVIIAQSACVWCALFRMQYIFSRAVTKIPARRRCSRAFAGNS